MLGAWRGGLGAIARMAELGMADTERMGMNADMLPMPLPYVPAEGDLAAMLLDYDEGRAITDSALQRMKDHAQRCWLHVVVVSLNYLHAGCDSSFERLAIAKGALSVVQEAALEQLKKQIHIYFDYDGQGSFETLPRKWDELLERCRLNYHGEIVYPAQEMTWEQLQPALPGEGQGGRVPVIELVDGALYDVLKEPNLLLKPENEWKRPQDNPGRKLWANENEWINIARGVYKTGVFSFIPRSELIEVDGCPVLHNCFGVGKGKYLADGREILRLVMNLDLTNSMLMMIIGDIRALPYPGQWQSIELKDDMVLVFSQSDLSAAYYAFGLPRTWWKHLAFMPAIPFEKVADLVPHLKGEKEVYACARVLAMGLNSAAGLMQYLHMRMALDPRPGGANLPPTQQLRCDRPVPALDSQGRAMVWEIFQDNFEVAELAEFKDLAKWVDTTCTHLEVMSDVYVRWGATQSESKTKHRQVILESLGYVRDGVAGRQYLTNKYLAFLLGYTQWVMQQKTVTPMAMMILAGKWNRAIQLAREVSSLTDTMYRSFKNGRRGIDVRADLTQDLFMLLCLLPLLNIDMRKVVSATVTASDASPSGCGVCRSVRLNKEALQLMERVAVNNRGNESSLLLVELFGGLAGLRQALALGKTAPAVHVSADTDAHVSRAVTMFWPKAIIWHDVTKIDMQMVKRLIPLCTRVKTAIVGGGYPCPAFSGLKAFNKGHREDMRVQEIARVAKLVKAALPSVQVKRFYENVVPKDVELEWMTSFLNEDKSLDPVRPVFIDGGDLGPSSRPRYYWVDVNLKSAEDCQVKIDESLDLPWDLAPQRVIMKVDRPLGDQWLQPGCTLAGWSHTGCVACFTRPIPRKYPPPQPAGIESCTPMDLKFWEADQFRYPPYQYKSFNMVSQQNGNFRTPCPEEREKALMYPPGITLEMLPMKRRHQSDFTDIRNGALGNGFMCGAVAWLLNRCMVQWGWTDYRLVAQDMLEEYFSSKVAHADIFEERNNPELDLVKLIYRHQVHVGGELRSLPGREFRQDQWPRHGVNGSWWHWRVVEQFQWGEKDSINVLEMRAVIATLRWKSSVSRYIGEKSLHLVDSQVVISALRKWRSGSPGLQRLIRRAAAIVLCASAKMLLAYVPTDQNPADRPSRAGDGAKKE